jgi:hypothetical protein
VEFEFSNSTSLLHSVSTAAKVLLALYFSHGLKNNFHGVNTAKT